MFNTSPQNALEIEKIKALLLALPAGETLTYQRISEAIGRNCRQGKGYTMISAREAAEKETGARFGTIAGHGIKRLQAHEISGIGASTRKRINRAAGKAFRRLSTTAYNDITDEDRNRINAEKSLLGAIAALTPSGVAKKVLAGTKTDLLTLPQIVKAI